MNWDYVSGKNKNKQTNKKQEQKITKSMTFFIPQLGSVFKNIMLKSIIYLSFSYQDRVYNVTFLAVPSRIYLLSRECHIIYTLSDS